MVENLKRKVKSEKDYMDDIRSIWEDIKSLDDMIEFWESKRPLKIFKEKRQKNDERTKNLYSVRNFFEKRLIELVEEKNRLYP